MTPQSHLRHYARIVQHFASTRAPEVLALQASPILGILLGGVSLKRLVALQPSLLLFGSLALTSHIFVFNDWVGYDSDIHDPRRATQVSARHNISRREIASVAIVLLILASVTLVAVGRLAILFGAGILPEVTGGAMKERLLLLL